MRTIITAIFTVVALSLTSCAQGQKDGSKEHEVHHISVDEFKKLDIEYQLVDVRTPDEYMAGAIEGAKNINYFSAEFLEQINELNKEQAVVLYCRSGQRSAKAADNLIQAGFKQVYNIKGGYLDYAKQ